MSRKTYQKWTTSEINRLKMFYHIMPKSRLEREFYPRTIETLHKMASQLGLRRRRNWATISASYTPVVFSDPHRVPANPIAASKNERT